MEIGGLERRCGACDGYGVDGVLALVLLVLTVRERRRKKRKKRKRKRQRQGKRKKDQRKGGIGKRNG